MMFRAFTKFCGAYGQTKAEDATKKMTIILTKLDPEAASAAQIKLITEKAEEIKLKLIKAKRALKKDKAETEYINEKIEKIKSALRILQENHGELKKGKRKDEVFEKAISLKKSLKTLQTDLEREQDEDKFAFSIVEKYETMHKSVLDQREKMRTKLEDAQKRMHMADAQKDQAQLRKQQLDDLNNLKGGFGELTIALDAMTQVAEENEVEAEMANMSADDMAETGSVGDDDLLKEVLASADTEEVVDPFDDIDK